MSDIFDSWGVIFFEPFLQILLVRSKNYKEKIILLRKFCCGIDIPVFSDNLSIFLKTFIPPQIDIPIKTLNLFVEMVLECFLDLADEIDNENPVFKDLYKKWAIHIKRFKSQNEPEISMPYDD